MKKLLVIVVLAVAGLLTYNYLTTGQIHLVPPKPSPAAQQLHRLASEFHTLVREYRAAAQGAGVSGIDSTYEAGALRIRIIRVQRQLDELTLKLTSPTDREDARKLSADIQRFLEELG